MVHPPGQLNLNLNTSTEQTHTMSLSEVNKLLARMHPICTAIDTDPEVLNGDWRRANVHMSGQCPESTHAWQTHIATLHAQHNESKSDTHQTDPNAYNNQLTYNLKSGHATLLFPWITLPNGNGIFKTYHIK